MKPYYVLRTFQVLLLRLLGTLHGCRHFMNKETKVQRTDAAFPRVPHKQAIEAQQSPGLSNIKALMLFESFLELEHGV